MKCGAVKAAAPVTDLLVNEGRAIDPAGEPDRREATPRHRPVQAPPATVPEARLDYAARYGWVDVSRAGDRREEVAQGGAVQRRRALGGELRS